MLQPTFISELIVDIDSEETRVSCDVSSVEGGSESARGHNLNRTAEQPVVTSPEVQFRPVSLTKRMLMRVGLVHRLIR